MIRELSQAGFPDWIYLSSFKVTQPGGGEGVGNTALSLTASPPAAHCLGRVEW